MNDLMASMRRASCVDGLNHLRDIVDIMLGMRRAAPEDRWQYYTDIITHMEAGQEELFRCSVQRSEDQA